MAARQELDQESLAVSDTRIYAEERKHEEILQPESKARANFGIFGIIALPLIVVGVLLAQTRSMADSITEDEHLDARIAEAKALGFSFEPSAFAQTGVTSENNAYPLLVTYFSRHVDVNDPTARIVRMSDPSEVKTVSPQLAEFIQHAHEVGQKKRFDAHAEVNLDNQSAYSAARLVAKTLYFDSMRKANLGDYAGAIDCLKELRNMCLSIAQDSSHMGLLTGAMHHAMGDDLATQLAYKFRGNRALQNQLLDILAEPWPINSFIESLKFDFSTRYASYLEPGESSGSLPRSVGKRAELSIALGVYIEQFKLIRDVHEPVLVRQKLRELRSGPKLSRLNPQFSPPSLWATYLSAERAATSRAITSWMIEIERDTKGDYPLSLPSRADPGLGGRLNYKRDGDSFIVYSTGEDKVDNGGPRFDHRQPNDIGWRFPPIPPEKGV